MVPLPVVPASMGLSYRYEPEAGFDSPFIQPLKSTSSALVVSLPAFPPGPCRNMYIRLEGPRATMAPPHKFQLHKSLLGAFDDIALPQAHAFGALEHCCVANHSQRAVNQGYSADALRDRWQRD